MLAAFGQIMLRRFRLSHAAHAATLALHRRASQVLRCCAHFASLNASVIACSQLACSSRPATVHRLATTSRKGASVSTLTLWRVFSCDISSTDNPGHRCAFNLPGLRVEKPGGLGVFGYLCVMEHLLCYICYWCTFMAAVRHHGTGGSPRLPWIQRGDRGNNTTQSTETLYSGRILRRRPLQ